MLCSSKLRLVVYLCHYVSKTHNTHPLGHNKLCTMKIFLVGFLPDGHGYSCETYPYGCGNVFIKSAGNGVGKLVHLCLVEETNLAVYDVRDDGTDCCCICFTAQEYIIEENAAGLASRKARGDEFINSIDCIMLLPDFIQFPDRYLMRRRAHFHDDKLS